MHVHLCVALWLFLFTRLLFLFVPLLFFRPFQMSSSEFHERLKSKSLCNFRLGTVATSDHETPLTGPLVPRLTRDGKRSEASREIDACPQRMEVWPLELGSAALPASAVRLWQLRLRRRKGHAHAHAVTERVRTQHQHFTWHMWPTAHIPTIANLY